MGICCLIKIELFGLLPKKIIVLNWSLYLESWSLRWINPHHIWVIRKLEFMNVSDIFCIVKMSRSQWSATLLGYHITMISGTSGTSESDDRAG
jgi:hypothetical protein